MTKKLAIIFISLLTLFSLFLRLYKFSEPNHYYFDEVYHAVTAKAYADNNPAAYDPFSPSPKEGTAYDWLHPPLAKLIQAGTIKIFGDVPVGWRLPSVIFGTMIVPATFILAFLMFGTRAAIFSSTIVASESLLYVMSRITMNDVFVTFFIVCSFIFAYLYSKNEKFKYLLLTSIFLGFSVATKWTGIYAIGAIFVYLLFLNLRGLQSSNHENPVGFSNMWKLSLLVIIPVFIYLLSYGQFWIQGHNTTDFINLHKQIWWYQNRHDLEHPYGTTPLWCVPKGLSGEKQFCPWILDIRGVYFSYETYGTDKAGYIYALGNPITFWIGLVAVSYLIGKYLEDRNKELFLILFGYFIFWVPWVFSPRIMFLYHYLPSIPFLAIAIGYWLTRISQLTFWGNRSVFLVGSLMVLGVIVMTFLYFFPISSGYPIEIAAIDKYMWLKTWR